MVTDIQMPLMTGKELCLALEEQYPQRTFPIFVMTSMTDREHREWTQKINNLEFLEKPLSMRTLTRELDKHFGTEQTVGDMTLMPNLPSFEIDFPRYHRWLNRAVGSKTDLIFFDNHGEPLLGKDNPLVKELGIAILAAGNEPSGLQRYDLNKKKTALYQSINQANNGLLGWVAVIDNYFEANEAPIKVDLLVEAMEDLVAGISDECKHKADLEKVTEELGARYEELHLVYAVDQHVQAHSGENEKVFQSLLQSAAEHLDVDVVAFVRPSREICQYATSLSKEIHNLDLVLIEMRGDLYRFIQASGETVVLNAEDDPRRSYIFTDMPYKVVACPVHTEGKVDSLVVLLNHQHKPDFTNSDRKLAEVLANQLSSLSNTYLLLESMKEFNQQWLWH